MSVLNTSPSSLADLVLKPITRDLLDQLVTGVRPFGLNGVNGLLLYGPPGTGKTTTAGLLPSLLDPHLATLPVPQVIGGWYGMMCGKGMHCYEHFCGAGNGGANNGTALLTAVENSIGNGLRGSSGWSYIILNEVDELKDSAMQSLRSLMDRFQNVCWIFTTNHLNKVEAGVKNRCVLIDMTAAQDTAWAARCNQILSSHGLPSLSEEALAPLFVTSCGSARDIMSNLGTAVNMNREAAAAMSGVKSAPLVM